MDITAIIIFIIEIVHKVQHKNKKVTDGQTDRQTLDRET